MKEVGLAKTNRVGIAPDATGQPMICYAGGTKELGLLSGLPEIYRWPEWNCIALPLCRQNLLVCETIGRIEESTPEYIAARNELLAAPMQYAHLYPPTPEGEPQPLRHQLEAFCWALDAIDRGINGFGMWAEMGTGKTRFACDLMRHLVRRCAVVVVQNSTSLQWKGWLERIWPEAEVRMLTGIPLPQRAELIREVEFPRGQPVVFVVNWESLSRLVELLTRLKPDVVIADEASRAKERTTGMSKGLSKLGGASGFRCAMSGTPMGNSPSDLWAIYRFIEPGLFGKSYWNYMKQFFTLGGFTGFEFTGFNPLQVHGFINRIYASAYRISKSCIGDLPEKSFETIKLEMAGEQAELYQKLEADMYARRVKEDGTVETLSIPNALAQCVRLQQVCAGLFPVDGAQCQPIASVKTAWLQQYCKETLSTSDVQICVWARFTAEIKTICNSLSAVGFEKGIDFTFISGSVQLKDREVARQAFNDRNNPLRILVIQIQAGSYGLDIPSCDVAVYHSNSFSYLERAQSLERGHRLGRTRPYVIIDLCCKGSVDEKIMTAISRKQSLSDMLLIEKM